jgi:enoyl-CoA hydratase
MDDDSDMSQGLGRRPLLGAAAAATIVARQGAGAQGATAEQPAPGYVTPTYITPTYVTLERRESILLIGINRPEVQNRIEVPTFLALGRAYWQLDHDEALRVAVLFAHGPDFSPGLDPPSWADGLRAQVFVGPISEFVNPVGTS